MVKRLFFTYIPKQCLLWSVYLNIVLTYMRVPSQNHLYKKSKLYFIVYKKLTIWKYSIGGSISKRLIWNFVAVINIRLHSLSCLHLVFERAVKQIAFKVVKYVFSTQKGLVQVCKISSYKLYKYFFNTLKWK